MAATDFDDNAGNEASCTGTTPIVLSATTLPYCRDIDALLVNNDVRTYFAKERGGPAFMLFTATYVKSTKQLTGITVKNSSGAGGTALVDWTGKVIELAIVASKEEIVGDQVELDSLPASGALDGTEILPVIQATLAKKITTEKLVSSPIVAAQGFKRNYNRRFSSMQLTDTIGNNYATNGKLLGAEPFWTSLIGAGSYCVQTGYSGNYLLYPGAVRCFCGTAGAGNAGILDRAGLVSVMKPIFLANTNHVQYFGCYVNIESLPASGSAACYLQFGFSNDPSGLTSDGLFFRAAYGQTNWHCLSMNNSLATGAADVDTGIPVATGFHTFEIYSNADDTNSRFYYDNALVASIDKTVNYPRIGLSNSASMFWQNYSNTTGAMSFGVVACNIEFSVDANTASATGYL